MFEKLPLNFNDSNQLEVEVSAESLLTLWQVNHVTAPSRRVVFFLVVVDNLAHLCDPTGQWSTNCRLSYSYLLPRLRRASVYGPSC